MKILIIKNDGFGDLIIIKDLLKKINKEKNEIDIVLSKHNEIFFNQLINIQNKYVFDLYGPNFNIKKNVPRKDKKLLKKLNNKSYDLCIVLRRYLNTEQVAILNHINDITYYDGKISILIWILFAGLKCIFDETNRFKNKKDFTLNAN